MSTTTDARKGPPKRRTVLLISLAVQLGLFAALWWFTPLRTSSMSVDKEEIEKRAVEVQKRERQRLEEERLRREKVAIKEEDAEKLRKKARTREARKVAEKVRDMRQIRERIAEQREASLKRLQQRSLDEANRKTAEDLLTLAEAIIEASHHLKVRSQLPLAQSTKPASEQLRDDTVTFLEEGDWTQSERLIEEAMAIREPLQTQATRIRGEGLEQDKERSRHGLFVHDSEGTIREIDVYLERLKSLLSTAAELAAFNDLGELEPQQQAPSESPADPASMDLDELVAETEALEQSTAEAFSQMRAAEIAVIENSTFDQAMAKIVEAFASASPVNPSEPAGQTNSPTSESRDPASQPAGRTTVGDLQNYRDAQAAKGRKATGHWTKAVNMAQQAGAAASRNQAGRSSQSFQTSNSQSPQGKGTGNTKGAAGNRGGDTSKSSRNLSQGEGTAFLSKTHARGKGTSGLRTQVPAGIIKAKALPGRRFRKDSKRQGWLFIDTWYVIGPWENHGQLNYDVTHPPEVAVDLDAEYSDGKALSPNSSSRHPLKWQFVQSDIMRITPPNEQARSTYYAYTEVYFEEAAEMLVAIATDDAARMWVNDKLVWEDQGQSAWNLDEGFRVIQFEKGFNKFLARIENSPTLCEFSVLLCPPDQIAK